MNRHVLPAIVSVCLPLACVGLSSPVAAQSLAAAPPAPMTTINKTIVYRVHADGSFVRDETSRDRMNTAQAIQRYGKTYFQYPASRAKFKVISAATQTAEGKKVLVPKNAIFTQQSPVSTAAPAFSDVKITAIVFPQLAPGAIKNYHIRKTVTQPLFPGNFSMVQYFPAFGEFKSASITLVAPEDMPIKVQVIGFKGGRVKANKPGRAKWVWTLKNPPTLPLEANSVSPLDYSPRIVATTFPDFQSAASAYLARAADKATVTRNIQKQADKITHGITKPRAQARALYNWVSGNIRYVALDLRLGGVVPRNADAILKSGYGDCKDHVVLLGALLAAKGIQSSPVLINGSKVYWQPEVAAMPGIYNHAITYVPRFKLFLDSTAQVAPFGVLPISELGKTALVTRTADGKAQRVRIPLPSPSADGMKVDTVVDIADDGSAKGRSKMSFTGGLGVVSRALLHAIPKRLTGQVANRLMAAFGQSGQGSLSSSDPLALETPFVINTSFSMPNVALMPGPGAFPIPLGVPSPAAIVGLARSTALPKRHFALSCVPLDKVESTAVHLPSAINVKRLPKDVDIKNSIGQYTARYTQDGQTIHVTRELVLTPTAATCTPNDYQSLKALGQAVARDARAQVFY